MDDLGEPKSRPGAKLPRPKLQAVPEDGSREEGTDPEARAAAALKASDRRSALRILMDAYGSEIFRYCYRMVQDRELAEDLLQTVFLNAYTSFERFRFDSSLRTWLYGISQHRCLDALKHRRRWRQRFRLVGELPEPPSQSTDTDAKFLSPVLLRCLSQLNPRARAAVILRHVAELTYPEMTKACGEKAATLQMRVARAMPVLRRCLEAAGVAP